MVEALQSAWHAVSDIHNVRIWLSAALRWSTWWAWACWIVLQKREPVATVSWLLGLALLPYLGFIVYHFFGPQRITRQRLRRARSKAPSLPPSAAAGAIAARRTVAAGAGDHGPAAEHRDAKCACWSTAHAKYTALLADIAQAREFDRPRVLHLPRRPHGHGGARRAGRTRARRRAACACWSMRWVRAKTPRKFFAPLVEAGGRGRVVPSDAPAAGSGGGRG